MIRKLLLFLCMLTAMISPVCAISFDIPETTVAEVVADPEDYDSTFTRVVIGLTGMLMNISDNPHISDGEFSIAVDMKELAIFEGFEEGDSVKMIGEFNYRRMDEAIFVPECVIHWPLIDAGIVPIPEMSRNPASYNGKRVTIIGNLSGIMESGMGYRIDLESDGARVKVLYYGGTTLEPGVRAKACGIFSAGTLYADTFRRKTALPVSIPGFSGLAAVCVLIFVLFVLSRAGRGGRKR